MFNAGYYLALEHGNLIKKKQPSFANNSTRLKYEKTISPGPGSYCIPSCISRKPKKINKTIEEQEDCLALTEDKLGPGSYNININPTKPRVKGIPRWNQESARNEITEVTNLISELEPETIDSKDLKESPSFASKVPRFNTNQKVISGESIKTTERMESNATILTIEKAFNKKINIVFLIIIQRMCQVQDIILIPMNYVL